MENNNQNANWQDAINEMSETASEQVNQTVENVQQAQPVQPVQADTNSWSATLDDDQNVYDAGNFAVLPAKKKANKTLIIVLVIVAAAILIGGGIFLLLSLNKGSGYEALERKYFSSLSEQLEGVSTQTKAGSDLKITLTPGSSMTGGQDVAPTVLKGKAYADAESLKSYVELTYAAGDVDIAGLKAWIDNEIFYFQFPELSDVIVKMDANDISSMMTDLQGSMNAVVPMMDNSFDAANPFAGYTDMLNNVDEKTMEKVLNVFVDAYFETAKNCTVKSTGTLQCGEVSVNCDINTITITTADLFDFLGIILNKVEGDSEIMNLLAGFGLDKATLSYAKTYVEQAKDSIPEETAKQAMITMTVYSKGNEIVGRTIDILGNSEIRIITVNDGGKFATEIALASNGVDNVKFVANGTVAGDKYDGTFELLSENSEGITGSFSLAVNNYVNGSVTISGNTDGVKQDMIFTIESNEKLYKFGMDIVFDGASMMKFDIESNTIDYVEVAAPTGATADITDPTDPNYTKFNTDFNNNLENIINKLSGLEKPDFVSSMIGMFGAMNGAGSMDAA